MHEYRNVANPSRCSENWCSNQCRLVNLSQKGRANGSRHLQSIGNTQIVRPAGSPRIPRFDGCDRIPCSPDRQFSSGAAATLTLVSNPSPRLCRPFWLLPIKELAQHRTLHHMSLVAYAAWPNDSECRICRLAVENAGTRPQSARPELCSAGITREKPPFRRLPCAPRSPVPAPAAPGYRASG